MLCAASEGRLEEVYELLSLGADFNHCTYNFPQVGSSTLIVTGC